MTGLLMPTTSRWPRALDQDTPPGLRRSGEAMAPAGPRLVGILPHKPEVRLVDQGRGPGRLAGLLLGHPLGSQLAQLLVDQRQQFLRGVGIALREGIQELGDIVVH